MDRLLINAHALTGGIKKPRIPKHLRGETRHFVREGGRHGSCCVRASSGVQRQKLISFRPFRLRYLATAKFGNGSGCNFDFIGNLRLRHASCLDFRNDPVPIHCDSFSISRNTTLRQVEMQVCNHQKMSLAERLIEAREERGWNKAELRRRAKIKRALRNNVCNSS